MLPGWVSSVRSRPPGFCRLVCPKGFAPLGLASLGFCPRDNLVVVSLNRAPVFSLAHVRVRGGSEPREHAPVEGSTVQRGNSWSDAAGYAGSVGIAIHPCQTLEVDLDIPGGLNAHAATGGRNPRRQR